MSSGTNAIQWSCKKPDGTIYVIGGDDFDAYASNALAVLGGDESAFDELVADMRREMVPMAAAVSTVREAFPGAVVTTDGFYSPQAGPGPQQGAARTSTLPVAVKIPWSEKAQADPYLTPLKADRRATWDAANKQWILMPGVDLTPFARWLPPGV